MTNPKPLTLAIDLCLKEPASTADEHERVLLQEDSKGTSKSAHWKLASLYSHTGRRRRAFACIEALAARSTSLEETASCLVAQGQLSEQQDDYESAVRYYGEALALNRRQAPTWYWIHNNLGYSLVQLGRCQEATTYLNVALQVDPTRSNAFKNMGLAMQGMNEDAMAAAWFVAATRVNPTDRRSLIHLEQLVTSHSDLLNQVPGLRSELEACRRLNPPG